MLRSLLVTFLSLFVLSGMVCSSEYPEEISKTIEAAGISLKVIGITDAELDGLKRVQLEGGAVVYVSTDGRLIFQGKLYEYNEVGFSDLTTPWESRGRIMALQNTPEESFIKFSPTEAVQEIVVFTDVECPFCQKFHQNIPALMEAGVAVRYLPYPRSGISSEGYEKLKSIWCEDDPRAALDNAKKGRRVRRSDCESDIVSSSFKLGQKMQIKGTPALILPDGTMITGYIEVDQLVEKLGL